MLCICSLFLKNCKLSTTSLDNFKNSILTIFVPLTIIENICFYPTLINFILFRQMAYQLIWVVNSMDKLISCVVLGPSQWFLHFGEEIIIAWTHMGWGRWIIQNLPLPVAQEVRDSSGVTPCIVMKNGGVLYHQASSFSPESMRLRSLHQSERTTVRSPV